MLTERQKKGWETLCVGVVVLLGLVARSYQANYDLDGDEIFSVNLVSDQFNSAVSRALADTPHPPLHLALLYVWIKAFGSSELAVRSLSILLSLGFLLVSYRLLRRFLESWLALGALGLLAISPLFVYYGEQARPYSLIAFLSSANLLAFVELLDEAENRKRLRLWAALCVALVYAHYLGTVLIGIEIAVALVYRRALRVALYGVCAAGLVVPWLLASMWSKLVHGADPVPQIDWIEVPGYVDLSWFYVSIFGESPHIGTRWLLLVLAIVAVGYTLRLVREKKLSPQQALLISVGIAMPVFEFALSVWGPKPIFADRQMLAGALAFVVLVGLGLAALNRGLAAVLLVVLLLWTATGLPQAFPEKSRVPLRDVLTRIHTKYGGRPVVAQETWLSSPLAYYRRDGSVRVLDQLSERELGSEFLFVCRTMHCSEIDSDELRQRHSLISVWKRKKERDQINLYEVSDASRLREQALRSSAVAAP